MRGKLLMLTLTLVLFLSSFNVLVGFSQGFPVTLTDDTGRTVTIKSLPQRIVSLAPSNTEILFALGLDDKVVGVTSYCDYPSKVKDLVNQGKITVVGGYWNPSVEKIIDLNPDLVLGSTMMGQNNLQTLEEKDIPVLVLDPKTIDDIYDDILMVGKATGTYDKAEALVDQMKTRIDAVKSQVIGLTKVKVVYICWLSPVWVAGGGTFMDSAINIAGGVNVFSELSGWKSVSPEAVIEKNPDIIVYTSMSIQGSGEQIRSQIKELFQPTNAVKNDQIYLLIGDASSMLERPGPGIVDGIEVLAKIFHPPAYGNTPKIITERKVTIQIIEPPGYSVVQVEAVSEAKEILTVEGDVKTAYKKLVEKGVISSEIPPIPKDSAVYESLIRLYGPKLERFPSVEGRIQLLYAMGILEV
ncbi:MAG: cobalamin-binding protein [Candidatus Hecatellales archaeon]|nr:MAG: cobalamin-binding protein [Candidatus Hecatellales archaeon]